MFPSTPNFRDSSADNLQNNLNPNYLFKSSGLLKPNISGSSGLLKPNISGSSGLLKPNNSGSSEKVYNDLYLKNNAHKQAINQLTNQLTNQSINQSMNQ